MLADFPPQVQAEVIRTLNAAARRLLEEERNDDHTECQGSDLCPGARDDSSRVLEAVA